MELLLALSSTASMSRAMYVSSSRKKPNMAVLHLLMAHMDSQSPFGNCAAPPAAYSERSSCTLLIREHPGSQNRIGFRHRQPISSRHRVSIYIIMAGQ